MMSVIFILVFLEWETKIEVGKNNRYITLSNLLNNKYIIIN